MITQKFEYIILYDWTLEALIGLWIRKRMLIFSNFGFAYNILVSQHKKSQRIDLWLLIRLSF
ncbi:hypothetical protein P872_18245 [Rhodonellum psychrophilum GCM71 = DSM 17998]|uniref:Uncharacterized protein n=1 Tax=Rhodonellum psychrophilum GCM71 = DSM 17998 TaxID=1123057 RepID=U5BP77_9BACT|nr:hypothetical protein P872_18245 [Rhodonellum psychrophilum GCM71 = DSM 17998]